MKSKVFLALAAGPVLGVLAFLAVAGSTGTPSPIPEAGHIYVPWHKSTRLTALEVKSVGPDMVEVMTRRDGKSGTSYVWRRIDCAAREFQYLGEGTTEQQAKQRNAADTRKTPLSEGSISFYVAAYACPAQASR